MFGDLLVRVWAYLLVKEFKVGASMVYNNKTWQVTGL